MKWKISWKYENREEKKTQIKWIAFFAFRIIISKLIVRRMSFKTSILCIFRFNSFVLIKIVNTQECKQLHFSQFLYLKETRISPSLLCPPFSFVPTDISFKRCWVYIYFAKIGIFNGNVILIVRACAMCVLYMMSTAEQGHYIILFYFFFSNTWENVENSITYAILCPSLQFKANWIYFGFVCFTLVWVVTSKLLLLNFFFILLFLLDIYFLFRCSLNFVCK